VEQLKRLEDIYQPDARYANRVDLDLTTGTATQMTVGSIYSVVEPIRLNDTVPEDVRSHFEVARNLAVYSWFVYPFHEVAVMHAMASLEMAARAKTGEAQTPFKNLLDKLFPGRELAPGMSWARPLLISGTSWRTEAPCLRAKASCSCKGALNSLTSCTRDWA
jgi:hypothetical protein